MLVSIYNNNGLDDVLMVMLKNHPASNQIIETKNNITEIRTEDTNEIVGYNFFDASEILDNLENGPIILNATQVDLLNKKLGKNDFKYELTPDTDPKFVVGEVKTCDPVKDSDHLHVTSIDIGTEEPLQIVCGASNISADQHVVVARVGAVMPDGTVIWPGELRGVKSAGMVCSAKELGIELENQEKGILVLSEDTEVGQPFATQAN